MKYQWVLDLILLQKNYMVSDQFDWVVLTVAGILNVRNEWPLSDRDLYDYSFDKYGESLNSLSFFETKKQR